MTTTIVTAFYIFKKSKHSVESYKKWISNFLQIRTRVVLFTDVYTREKIFTNLPDNFHIIICEKSEFLMCKYDWSEQLKMDHESSHSIELYLIWNEKANFITKAIQYDSPQSDFYYWADIGGFRNTSEMDKYAHWPSVRMCKAIADKITLLNIYPFTQTELNSDYPVLKYLDRIGGGYFGGSVKACLQWHKLYYDMLDYCIHRGIFCGKDQTIMAYTYLHNKDLVHLVQSNDNCGDRWFYLHPYLSGICADSRVLLEHVTILVPLYNGIEYLSECLDSVRDQTWHNYEVLIGINGHADNVVYNRAKEIAGKYPFKIRVKNYTTIGKPATMTEMLGDVVGELVCILDVDDKWAPRKLELQMAQIQNYNVVGSRCHLFGERSGIVEVPSGDISGIDFYQCNPIINSSVLLRKYDLQYAESGVLRDLEAIGAEDYSLWLRMRKAGKKFYNISDPLVYHRVHHDSFFNPRVSQEHIQTIRDIIKNMP